MARKVRQLFGLYNDGGSRKDKSVKPKWYWSASVPYLSETKRAFLKRLKEDARRMAWWNHDNDDYYKRGDFGILTFDNWDDFEVMARAVGITPIKPKEGF